MGFNPYYFEIFFASATGKVVIGAVGGVGGVYLLYR